MTQLSVNKVRNLELIVYLTFILELSEAISIMEPSDVYIIIINCFLNGTSIGVKLAPP